MTENDHAGENTSAKHGRFTQSTGFAALVGLWFAALFGGGCLFLPPVLFDAMFSGESPFGPSTRIVFALAAATIGLLLGLFIASRVRSGDDQVPRLTYAKPATKPRKSRKSRKSTARPPLDIRAALGVVRGENDDDEDEVAAKDNDDDRAPASDDYDLTHIAPPIDDPHFASAWIDSDAYEPEFSADDAHDAAQEEPIPLPYCELPKNDADQAPAEEWNAEPEVEQPVPAPSRYNPFANFVTEDEPEDEEPGQDEPLGFAQPSSPLQNEATFEPEAIELAMPHQAASPSPPVWPQPRAEEPELTDLGVAELVERLARALQGDAAVDEHQALTPRTGAHRHESALAPKSVPDESDIDHALRVALDRLTRLDDVA